MTAFTTLPFLTVPSGEASLTAAVTMSPRPAFLPRPPPRGRITCSLRAPELSATSRIVLICTDIVRLLVQRPGAHALWLNLCSRGYFCGQAPRVLLLGFRGGGLLVVGERERGATNDLLERPALQLRQGACLTDADNIADAGGVLLVVRIELLVRLHRALVFGVSLAHLDLDDDGLLHLCRNHQADLLVAA